MPLNDMHRKRLGRNVALALALIGLVVIFYLVTVAKLGPQVLDRPF